MIALCNKVHIFSLSIRDESASTRISTKRDQTRLHQSMRTHAIYLQTRLTHETQKMIIAWHVQLLSVTPYIIMFLDSPDLLPGAKGADGHTSTIFRSQRTSRQLSFTLALELAANRNDIEAT